jgi:L-ascorbate metabolism protein UlaG (beta-lactamase superfamily)
MINEEPVMNRKLRWLGMAFFEYVSGDGKTVIFDPWTKSDGNPSCDLDTADIEKADLVLVSHDHFDHVASAVSICKRTGAILGGADETMKRLIAEEGMPVSQVINGGNGYIVGGGAELNWVSIKAVPAVHTSRTSAPMGTIARFGDGTSIYHTGDTGITADMEIYSRLYGADVVMLPLMPRCNMDIVQAVEAIRMIKPKIAIPMHYDVPENPKTIAQDFAEMCKKANPKVHVLIPEKNKYYSLNGIV